MATSNNDKYKNLLNLHRALVDAIAATEKDINQCSLEWLQLCDISKKRNQSLRKTQEDRKPNICNKTPLTTIEDTSTINNQPIDVNIEFVKVQYIPDEEFDSE